MSDQSASPVIENEPAVVASADPAPVEAAPDPVVIEDAADPVPASSVDIPEGWASLHWKHVIMLAKRIAGNIETSFEDAKRIISDELVTRDATGADDGLVAMTKNGDTIRVNATTVEAHKRAGWAIV